MEGNVKKHMEICIEANKLYAKKNKDYGNSFSKSFEEYGLTMPCIRLEDKLNRLKSLIKSGRQEVNDESIRDTLIDLANYAVMTIVELDAQSAAERGESDEDVGSTETV